MIFVNIDFPMHSLFAVKSDLFYYISNNCLLSPKLRGKILQKLEDEPYDVITVERGQLTALANLKYKHNENRNWDYDQKEGILREALRQFKPTFIKSSTTYVEPMGLYTRKQTLPASKIWLCPETVMDFCKNEAIFNDNEIYQLVYVHEVGHHVFSIDYSSFAKRLISEGLANFFVYLVSNARERLLLSEKVKYQPERYSFYLIFVLWSETDPSTCIDALIKLIDGQYLDFLVRFVEYLLVHCNEQIIQLIVDDIPDSVIEMINPARMDLEKVLPKILYDWRLLDIIFRVSCRGGHFHNAVKNYKLYRQGEEAIDGALTDEVGYLLKRLILSNSITEKDLKGIVSTPLADEENLKKLDRLVKRFIRGEAV